MSMASGTSATEFPWVKKYYKNFWTPLIIILELYEYSIYFNSALISVYILTNIYNILWVLLPWFGKLSSVMKVYKNRLRKAAQKDEEKPVDKKILGDLYEIYYTNRDLKLFLELLAMGSGVAPAISVMAIFDSVRRLDKLLNM